MHEEGTYVCTLNSLGMLLCTQPLNCLLANSFSANMRGVCVCVVEDDVLMTGALHRAYLGLKKYKDAVESLQKVDTALSHLAMLVVDYYLYLSVLHLHHYTGSGPGADG